MAYKTTINWSGLDATVSDSNRLEVEASTNIKDYSYFNSFLTSGTSIEATGNYSAGASGVFSFVAPTGSKMQITRLITTISDAGIKDAGDYGAISALTTGLQVHVVQSGIDTNLTLGNPITHNADWGAYCYDMNFLNFGVGSDFILSRWTFERAGTRLFLNGSPDRFYILLNDDFTGLIDHKFQIQGVYE